MYNNLIAEAARKGLSYATMAEKLKMHRNTFENKINGKSKIFLEEAENLHREFFQNLLLSICLQNQIKQDKEVMDMKETANGMLSIGTYLSQGNPVQVDVSFSLSYLDWCRLQNLKGWKEAEDFLNEVVNRDKHDRKKVEQDL